MVSPPKVVKDTRTIRNNETNERKKTKQVAVVVKKMRNSLPLYNCNMVTNVVVDTSRLAGVGTQGRILATCSDLSPIQL